MICIRPYINAQGIPCPCGQCAACRKARRRLWTHRMILESYCHEFNSFVTLTYSDEYLPANGSLSRRHCQLWLKRLRDRLSQADPARSVRFYLVGEYGDASWRPHYHAALFGVSHIEHDLIRETWQMGHVALGDLTMASAQYIGGYVTKKMTSKDDFRLRGRYPEFATMSRRPGLGALFVPMIADQMLSKAGWEEIERTGDVPVSLRHGGRILPLGRYLRQKLREELGVPESFKTEALQKYKEKLRSMFPDVYDDKGRTVGSLKNAIIEGSSQKVLQLQVRSKIFDSRRSL